MGCRLASSQWRCLYGRRCVHGLQPRHIILQQQRRYVRHPTKPGFIPLRYRPVRNNPKPAEPIVRPPSEPLLRIAVLPTILDIKHLLPTSLPQRPPPHPRKHQHRPTSPPLTVSTPSSPTTTTSPQNNPTRNAKPTHPIFLPKSRRPAHILASAQRRIATQRQRPLGTHTAVQNAV